MSRLCLRGMAVLVIPCLGCGGISPGNMVRNPGFEAGSGVEPPGWVRVASSGVGSVRAEVTGEDFRSGGRSYRVGRLWGRGYLRAGLRTAEVFPVDRSGSYLVSLWYRTSEDIGYSLPVMLRVSLDRAGAEPLRLEKQLSASESWRQVYWVLPDLPPEVAAATVWVCLTVRTPGELYVDDVVFRRANQRDIDLFQRWRRSETPTPAGSAEGLKLDGTGRFRVEEAGGRWWLVDPRGKPTWIMGTMGSYPGPTGNGNPELVKWAEARYDSRLDYCRMAYDLIAGWGFNGLAGWTPEEFDTISGERFGRGDDYLPTFRVMGLSGQGDKDYYLRDRAGDLKGGGHSFADPFNPRWRSDARAKAESIVGQYRERPWFVGYFIDNEIDYGDALFYLWADYSGREFVRYLEGRYGGIDALNRAWTSSFGSYAYGGFDRILTDKPEPRDFDDPLYEDFAAFERRLIGEYIEFTYDLVKGLDPAHLVISNRLNLDPMGDLARHVDLWGRYDVVAMNIYPQNLHFGFSPGEIELMKSLHRGTGRPIIIGEWSVPALDSGLYDTAPDPQGRPLDWSWPQVFDSQAERGEAYRICLTQLASLPFTVGTGWFMFLDVDSPTRRANRGIIGAGHRPYAELTAAMSGTHAELRRVMGIGR